MYLFYIDESGIEKESKHVFFSAIGLEHTFWKTYFNFLKDFRDKMNKVHGLYKYKEWHASKFIGGRGNLGKTVIHKSIRLNVFNLLFDELAKQSYLKVINIKCEKRQTKAHLFAFNCLLNRLEKFLKSKNEQAMILIDSGHDKEYRSLYRKLHVINPIPSIKGHWEDGAKYKNIPLGQFIEDPVFSSSDISILIQVSDFIVYSLNRFYYANSRQRKFGLHNSFLRLKPILCLEASTKHALGIVEI